MSEWKQRELLVPQGSLSCCSPLDPVLHRAVAALSTQNQPQRLGAVPAPRRPHRGHQLVHADLHQAARVLSCALSCSCPAPLAGAAGGAPSCASHACRGVQAPPAGSSQSHLDKEAAAASCSSQPAGTWLLIAFATISCSGRGNRLQIKRSIIIFLIDALEPYFPPSQKRWLFVWQWLWLGFLALRTDDCSGALTAPCQVPPHPGESLCLQWEEEITLEISSCLRASPSQ